eukprot:g2990.t1
MNFIAYIFYAFAAAAVRVASALALRAATRSTGDRLGKVRKEMDAKHGRRWGQPLVRSCVTPQWLYDAGVPAVRYKSGGMGNGNGYAPFYLNPTFQYYYARMLRAAPTMQLFNRYAGAKDPATAPGALLLLRGGLDGANFQRFPAAEYGDDSRAVQCVNGSAAAAFPGGGCTCSGSEGPVCCRE